MGIRSVGNIFGEVVRFYDLADVMEIRCDAADCGIGSDDFCGRLRQVGNGETVMVGARRLKAQTLEERMVQITHLKP